MNGDGVSERLRDLEIGFARLEATMTTKLDELTKTLTPRHEDHEARIRVLEASHDETITLRLSKLEQWKWTIVGAALAGGGGAGGIAAAILGAAGGS